MKKIFFVSYGGGHIKIVDLICRQLVDRAGIEVRILALTTAYAQVIDRYGPIHVKRVSDYLDLFDDSIDSNVSVFPDMIDWGMDVYLDSDNFTLHHKYMIIDGFNAGEESVLITGSHNWSTSAETRHNENTIIIYDSLIVNQYVQEFAARYKTASGLDLPKPEVISVKENDAALPEKFSLSQNYPNPFNPVTAIEYTLPQSGDVSLIVYNLLGQEVVRLVDDFQQAGYNKITWDA